MSGKQDIGVVDLFCGVGGLSHGLKQGGLNIIAGFDIDKTCEYAYTHNNGALFFDTDITKVTKEQVIGLFDKTKIRVLAGCAPCQPFSSYAFKNKKKDPDKYDLLYQFGRLVEEVQPDIVTMENVPQIASFTLKNVLQDFIDLLHRNHYYCSVQVVYCPNYGIPQTRKRLVLLASKLGEIHLIPPTHNKENYVTVRDTIGELPHLEAGASSSIDPLHRAKSLSPLNMQRIMHTPYGGSWKDWPDELKLNCHKSERGRSFGSVYGRMRWECPAPTMTTQCTGLGNGRFGHPEQNRAITAREAALIQTFPREYKFFADEENVSIVKASRYIGNAVPPQLGFVIAQSIIRHIEEIK